MAGVTINLRNLRLFGFGSVNFLEFRIGKWGGCVICTPVQNPPNNYNFKTLRSQNPEVGTTS